MKTNYTDQQSGKSPTPGKKFTDSPGEAAASTKPKILTVPQLILTAQRELETARKTREQAERYLQETVIKARSEAHRLILRTRLTIRKDTEKLMHQANEEIQKVLADIRMIRITAREELAAQKKFTDAARLRSFTLSLQKEDSDLEDNISNQPAGKKPSVN